MTWTMQDILGIYIVMIFIGFIILLIGVSIIKEFSNSNSAIYIGSIISIIGSFIMGAPILVLIVYYGGQLASTFIEVTEYLFANF